MISDCLPKPLSFDGLHGTELAKVWEDGIGMFRLSLQWHSMRCPLNESHVSRVICDVDQSLFV